MGGGWRRNRGPRVEYRCSFCGKSQEQVHRLIAGTGGVYICDECIDLCQEIIAKEHAGPSDPQGAGPELTVRERDAKVSPDCVFCGERVNEDPVWSAMLWRWESLRVTAEYGWYCHEECLKEWKPARLGEGFGTRTFEEP